MSRIIPAYTPLKVADFAWVNQSTATATDSGGGINIVATTHSSNEGVEALVKTAPTLPYIFTVHMQDYSWMNAGGAGGWWYMAGIIIRNSTSGKLIIFGTKNDGTNSLPTASYINITTYSSVTAGVANIYYTAGVAWDTSNLWFRIENNNTNRLYSMSRDGINWTQLYSEGNSTYMAENQIGIYTNPWQGNIYCTYDSFKIDYSG